MDSVLGESLHRRRRQTVAQKLHGPGIARARFQRQPGTEVIFICADRSKPPRLEEIQPLFAGADPWPDMSTSAVYHREVLTIARKLLAARRLRPYFLVEALGAHVVTEDALREVDPELASFRNCNTPEEYERALADAGYIP